RADTCLEEGLAGRITKLAVLGQQRLQGLERRRSLLGEALERLVAEQLCQLPIGHLEDRHAAHDSGMDGKTRADVDAAGDRAARRETRDIDDLAALADRHMGREAGLVA